jgi:PadR family transcriptional regulator, regulatory protein AphA
MPSRSDAELGDVAYAILGMLSLGARSGYEVKRWVDRSARSFFAISPPQVYGALKELEGRGFVKSKADPNSGRRRRIYEVTGPGRKALRVWLEDAQELSLEVRDKAMLRLFFADLTDDQTAKLLLGTMRERSRRALERFEADILPASEQVRERDGHRFPELTARFGLEFHRWVLNWCEEIEAELDAEAVEQR